MIFFKSLQAARGQHGGGEPTTRANLKRNLGKYAPVTPRSRRRDAVSAAGATQEEGEEQGGPQ